jgi:antitoxin component YwqK of YwqJK toxin-antitoxin module
LLSGFFLLLISVGEWGCVAAEDRNSELLRQVMREENGRIRWKVYGYKDDPSKEKVEVYFGNGQLKEVFYRRDGQVEGVRTVFYDDGNLSETGTWHKNNRMGEFRYYRQDGKLECVQYFGLIGDRLEDR